MRHLKDEAMRINSVSQLVDKAGGSSALARLLKTSPQNVNNWRERNKLPSHLMLQQRRVLERCGYRLPVTLWLRSPARSSSQ
jgi:DNA-binding transcriptional regulator YiaG